MMRAMPSRTDLSVRFGDISLKNPFIVASGPTTRSLDQIKAAEDAGWAAACLKLTIAPVPAISLPPRYRWLRKNRMHVFTAEKRLAPDEGLRLMRKARETTSDIFLFANVTYDGPDDDGWVRIAREFEEAGAHGIELNCCCPNMSYNLTSTGAAGASTVGSTGASLGQDLERLPRIVNAVADGVKIPVTAKLTPEGGRITQAAALALAAGAVAVGSTANRLGIPDIDIRHPEAPFYRLQEGLSLGCLSGPWIRPLALRDTYELRRSLGPKAAIIASGGISDLESAVQQIMVGADALWVCTQTMIAGFAWLPKLLEELRLYMGEMGWSSLADFRGLLARRITSAQNLGIQRGHAALDGDQCTACGACWQIGHCRAITHPGDRTVIDQAVCLACSTCVDLCPRGAIQMVQEG